MRERAVRMVRDHEGEHGSQWSAIQSIAAKIGCSGEKRDGYGYREEPKRKVDEREGRVEKAERHEEVAKDFGKGMEASTGRDGGTGRG